MENLPRIERVSDIRTGSDPVLEAWLYHFMTENNIEYLLNPSIVASPEQMRFMVALEDDQIYLPCDDDLFFLIYRQQSAELSEEYLKTWRFITSLVRTYDMSEEERGRILTFCRYRFNLFFSERMVLPSRMVKRLLTIVLTQCGDPDPFRELKRIANERILSLMNDPAFLSVLHCCPDVRSESETIPHMRWNLHCLEMARLLVLSTYEKLWKGGDYSLADIEAELERSTSRCLRIKELFGPEDAPRKKVLYIPDVAGAFVFDLALIRSLQRQGHQVMLALKDAFYFDSPTIWDIESEEQLTRIRDKGLVVHNDHLTKNELLHMLREHKFLILSDGLSEQLNLYRASVTFARAWKECDLVVAKGRRNSRLLLGSSHRFTRDILCCWRDDKGEFQMDIKPRADWVRQFPEQEIIVRARQIVAEMRQARDNGKTVMFYSAIIGSIPGQTKIAVELVTAFVKDLRARLDNTFIINPAEHFEEGMDGDDLMYMWEHVQRCGLLDVWRFQTVEDIERSFALLGKKVPSAWSGKDSTFSTGCTKEMRIALDEQKKHPEMQIIGPSAEKFFRRRDYGVGKYFDATLRG
ncbi:ARMT1-like domain-containing protein [Desulfovibrio sp. OttesenSCG-928-M16]|nr:ARMT1-like domain-containing protein [Desulfovibrio sp. OttesenSCG-928-M16]